ncbi:MAG TPA: hypothetical protein VFL82_04940 [Thermomicrobiales bacterium]|nr:hypothetical protein [Thermomicrobiales bacterium]
MRKRDDRRIHVLMSMLALMALVVGLTGVGLARAQDATPVPGYPPTDLDSALPTTTAVVAPTPTATPTLVPTSTPPASPAPARSVTTVHALDTNLSVVPDMTATNFSPASSTFSFPQGYSHANTTATINLATSGDVADIADWQITINGDPQHELISITPDGFVQMDFTVFSFQGLSAPVAGVTTSNVGQPLANSLQPMLILRGDRSGFTAGTPNQLSFAIVLGVSPTWVNPPGTYQGGLILTISGSPPSAP